MNFLERIYYRMVSSHDLRMKAPNTWAYLKSLPLAGLLGKAHVADEGVCGALGVPDVDVGKMVKDELLKAVEWMESNLDKIKAAP